jgi:hypothetical protein
LVKPGGVEKVVATSAKPQNATAHTGGGGNRKTPKAHKCHHMALVAAG